MTLIEWGLKQASCNITGNKYKCLKHEEHIVYGFVYSFIYLGDFAAARCRHYN